ncbi:MAG: GTP 3',8-cyclase MoaA [Candidatus Bathyarchaeota archaeon]|nr:GTP 3',8-cyclase MoaA [Candidatus Bathyarchaeota archaeon]
MTLHDCYNRPLLNLRISITQRCNLKCIYCHREGEVKRANRSAEKMTRQEIVRIAQTAVDLGIKRIKLTGGEPLMRKDVVEVVRGIAGISGLKDLSMTTNGLMLKDMAVDLFAAGLKRINISLATLNPATYHRLTGGNVQDALAGVQAAVDAGFCPVKLNMVVLEDVNVGDIPDMITFAGQSGVTLQLIELDPINVSNTYYEKHHRFLDATEAMLEEKAVNVEIRPFMHNRKIYHLPKANVEVVHPIDNTDFCMHCTRMRVTSDGKLKPCLMRNDNLTDLLTPIRNGATDEELQNLFRRANQLREPYNKTQTQN